MAEVGGAGSVFSVLSLPCVPGTSLKKYGFTFTANLQAERTPGLDCRLEQSSGTRDLTVSSDSGTVSAKQSTEALFTIGIPFSRFGWEDLPLNH